MDSVTRPQMDVLHEGSSEIEPDENRNHGSGAGGLARRIQSFKSHREPGVGQYFLDSLFADTDSLVIYAGVHPIREGYYRMIAKKFPFAERAFSD